MKVRYFCRFLLAAAAAIVIICFSWGFLSREVGAARFQERTISGDRNAAEGLTAAFRADSSEDLHWINEYDYSEGKAASYFAKGKMTTAKAVNVYRDFRFTGWRTEPYYTRLKYEGLGGIQEGRIQEFYDKLQKQSKGSDKSCEGTIRLKDYAEYYPVSFRFQFGEKVYNSAAMLRGLKALADKGELAAEDTAPYEGDIELFKVLNENFRIPVIDEEYQRYRVLPDGETRIDKPIGAGMDYYEFDPVIVLQQENIKDGVEWKHPDTKRDVAGDNNDMVSASEYGYKNRMLFIVNNRTAKGNPVDVSEIRDGFGIYELPIDTAAGITIGKGRKNMFIPDPRPMTNRLSMVCPLDEEAEYVEMALSGNHRQLVLFYIKDEDYYAEIIDADTWESILKEKMFPASEEMVYGWGADDTFAVSNGKEQIAVFTKAGDRKKPYELFYKGSVPEVAAQQLFAAEMITKKHSYSKHAYGIDNGIAISAESDRVALVNNSLIGDSGYKNPDVICAVIGEKGLVYEGALQGKLVDVDDSVTDEELKEIMKSEEDLLIEYMIRPAANQNRTSWNAKKEQ